MTDPGTAMMAAAPLAPEHLNYLAVLAAGAANFLLGGLWYSPVLFAAPWMKAAGLNPKKMDMSGVGLMYAGAVLTSLVVALSLAYLLKLTHAASAVDALRVAWTCVIGFAIATALGDYQFLRRSMTLYAINMGLHVVTFTASALILSAWR